MSMDDYRKRVAKAVSDLALDFDAYEAANWRAFRQGVLDAIASIERAKDEVAVEMEHELDEDED